MGLVALVVALSSQAAFALNESDTLSRAEKILFGHIFSDESADVRIAKIEKRIFGKKKPGEMAERLERVSSVLLLDKKELTTKPAPTPATHAPHPPTAKTSSLHQPVVYSAEYGFGRQNHSSDAQKPDIKNLLRQGMQAHREGRLEEAEKHFRTAVLTDPRNADAYFNLGALAEKKGDLVSALSNYRAALHLNPEDGELKEAVVAVESHLAPPEKPKPAELKAGPLGSLNGVAQAKSETHKNGPLPAPQFVHQDRRSIPEAPVTAPDLSAERPVHTPDQEELSVTNQEQHVAEVYERNNHQVPVEQTPLPQDGQPFQLATSKSRARANAAQNNGQTGKKVGNATKAILGVALSVGANYALRASGLHCPICRFGGGGGIMRGLLRGL